MMGIRNRLRNEALGAAIYGDQIAMPALGRFDDRVQSYARNTYRQAADALPDSWTGARGAVESFADMVHAPRSAYSDDFGGRSAMMAARGLQAGGITAAGAGLINLTHQFQNAFGGPGDQSKPGTLEMY